MSEIAIAVETEDLTKEFNGLTALNKVSLEVKKGELFGLLGPNGAGKTTFLNILSTMIKPSSGRATVNSFDVERNPDLVRESIGMVFQDTSLDERLTGRENLDLHGRLYGLGRQIRRERIQEVLHLVELEERADALVKTYSGGMMRRLEIARGLMHAPKVLFLDEPTLGLDPQTRRKIWDYIRRLNREQEVSMILTTHYMDEADALCDRVAIIDKGKVVALDTPENLKNQIGGDIITLHMDNKIEVAAKLFEDEEYIEKVGILNGTLNLTVDNGEHAIPKILEKASHHNIEIESVSLRKPTLEDVFLHHTGRAIREQTADEMDRIRGRLIRRRR